MGVEVRLTGSLIARAGARRTHVAVPGDATVEDVVDELAAKYGPQVRPALLEGERLRSDTVAVRESPTQGESLGVASPVERGDTVRFELRAEA